MEKIKDAGKTTTEQVEEAFVVVIHRCRHNEQKSRDAKVKEFKKWDDFKVYEELEFEGQDIIGTTWMPIEKNIYSKLDVKFHLCVRGDLEKSSKIRTESPTGNKTSINLF